MSRYLFPALALLGLGFATYTVILGRQTPPPAQPIVAPPDHPTFHSIAGAGLIEAQRENIPVGTPEPGVVWEVFVQVDNPTSRDPRPNHVNKNDPLFRLDDRAARAQVVVSEATLAAAQAAADRLRVQKPLDIPPAEAAVLESEARLQDAEVAFSRAQRLRPQLAITDSEYDKARFTYDAANANLRKVRADLARLQTWNEELKVAEAAVLEARAQLDAAKVALERLTIRALDDGQILQVNVRPGQFAAIAWKEPLIVLGDRSRLHVRVDIDEQDLPFFRPNTRAVATLKGRPGVQFDLQFIRVDPYVIPKRSLTGDNSERVDTRVLQVLYALPQESPVPLFVGQQMDVFIASTPPPEGVSLDFQSGKDRNPADTRLAPAPAAKP